MVEVRCRGCRRPRIFGHYHRHRTAALIENTPKFVKLAITGDSASLRRLFALAQEASDRELKARSTHRRREVCHLLGKSAESKSLQSPNTRPWRGWGRYGGGMSILAASLKIAR